MATICPTVTATEPHAYREQLEQAAKLSKRVHVDIADGSMGGSLIDISKIWFPEDTTIDLHVMYKQPLSLVEAINKLKPNLVIVHAEAEGSFVEFAKALTDIKVGVALLPATNPEIIKPALDYIDHVLIFSGDLGHFGGTADLGLLKKVKVLKNLKPSLEIGWDGGIDDKNAGQLANGGVDVLNTGGFIQKAKNPQAAYATLKEAV